MQGWSVGWGQGRRRRGVVVVVVVRKGGLYLIGKSLGEDGDRRWGREGGRVEAGDLRRFGDGSSSLEMTRGRVSGAVRSGRFSLRL